MSPYLLRCWGRKSTDAAPNINSSSTRITLLHINEDLWSHHSVLSCKSPDHLRLNDVSCSKNGRSSVNARRGRPPVSAFVLFVFRSRRPEQMASFRQRMQICFAKSHKKVLVFVSVNDWRWNGRHWQSAACFVPGNFLSEYLLCSDLCLYKKKCLFQLRRSFLLHDKLLSARF